MEAEELISELRKLKRSDKLRAMEVLVSELAAEEPALQGLRTEYEVWSPLDAPSAATKLMKMLEDDKESRNAG